MTMKLEKFAKVLALTVISCSIVVGCKSPQRLTPLPGRGQAGPVGGEGPGRAIEPVAPIRTDDSITTRPTSVPPGGGATTTLPLNTWSAAADQPFKRDTLYFEYDKSVVKASEVSKVERVASGMKSGQYAGKAVRIEGHCDERGTEEYNRSLGERRALAIREKLVSLGLDPQMIDTVSYGEDRPVDPGHTEAAWSKNRRGDFILLEPPGGGGRGGASR